MRTINLEFETMGAQVILLGVQGESLVTKITADVSGWLEEWPDGEVVVRLIDENGLSHLADTVVEDGTLVWTVTAADTAAKGYGVGVTELVQGDVVKKSIPFTTRVIAEPNASGEAPEVIPGWVEQLISQMQAMESDAEASKNAAVAASNTAQAAASTAIAQTGLIDEVILVQDDEPTAEHNKLYIKRTLPNGIEVATEAELDALRTEVQGDLAEIQEDVQTAKQQSEGAVKVTEQTLTDAQQAQARENIGAADQGDVADLKSEIAQVPSIVTPEETEADLYVCDSNGNVIAKFVDGHIVTKNFDSSTIQLDLIMEADSDEADLYISDSFGNVVAEFKDGQIVTKNFDSANMDGIPGDVATLQTEVAALQSATSGILYRNMDATDGVYAACRFHQPNASSKQFCILIAGDVHADRTRTQNMIEYLNALDAFDAGIMLGDISGNAYTDTIAFYLEALGNVQKPFLTVLGNHDVVGAASDAELYAKFGDCFQYAQLASGEAVSGKCYYYKDFAAQKIRAIVLMQYDLAGRASDTGDLCFGQDQINWFIGVLNSTPSDYGVIIAEHTNPSRHMTYNMDLSVTSDTWRQSNYAPTVMDGDPVPDIVNAWISGTTLSKTYSYTFSDPPTPLSVSADFTSRGAGEFITYLGGHWHMDVLGTPTGYSNQPDYHTPAAGLSAATQGDMPRKIGARSEDSLSAISVDRDKKTVKVFHVGAHFTKDAFDRLYFKYTYGA